ncbi:integration host factor subunit beta [Methylobacterium sp. WL8]|uniref:integration host factor subunit beta n=1 Tax=Methylobacterium sp. WL8 TaxID=2603899 RepID=UPI0011C8F77E|nr:integration host factor subunit beta [Methylobacterium sp. WL8]TXN77390.1 integration host factor subunit beta [Methylobacterium sp. WL8]
MIRSDLVLRLAAQNLHLYEKDCQAVVDAILGRISDALVAGDRVEIRGFGSFSVKERQARPGRNPKTGAKVSVPAKGALVFKPGKEMRERVNPEAR